MARTIRLIREGHPTAPGLDTAISRAMLTRASAGLLEESFRIYTPGRVVAFGKRDTLEPGYSRAVDAARAGGFVPIERLAGGRAAVFHEGTLAFGWTHPIADPRPGIPARFGEVSEMMVAAFARLGIDTKIGQLPGEYCPGKWSVHAGGRLKMMGVGQRLARHAAQTGGVVVVHGAQTVNAILTPVYAALGIEWRPAATGALEDIAPDITLGETATAIITEMETRFRVLEARLDPPTLAQARNDAAAHISATL